MVGVIDTPCWDAKFQGAIKFDLAQLYNIVGGYSLQNATLRFKQGGSYFQSDSSGDYGLATNEKPLCGVNLGLLAGGGEWTNWNLASALQGSYPPLTFVGNTAKSLPTFSPIQYEVNVTDYVDYLAQGWPNAGFGFVTNIQTLIDQDYFTGYWSYESCWNRLLDFELEIRYYSLGE